MFLVKRIKTNVTHQSHLHFKGMVGDDQTEQHECRNGDESFHCRTEHGSLQEEDKCWRVKRVMLQNV